MRSVATLVATLGTFFTIFFEAAVITLCPWLAARTACCSPSSAASSPPPYGRSGQSCAVALLPRALPRPMASSSCTGLKMGTHDVYADEPAQIGTTIGRLLAMPSSPPPLLP